MFLDWTILEYVCRKTKNNDNYLVKSNGLGLMYGLNLVENCRPWYRMIEQKTNRIVVNRIEMRDFYANL